MAVKRNIIFAICISSTITVKNIESWAKIETLALESVLTFKFL